MKDVAGYLVGKGYCVLVSEWYPVTEYGRTYRCRRVFRSRPACRFERAGQLASNASYRQNRKFVPDVSPPRQDLWFSWARRENSNVVHSAPSVPILEGRFF